MYKNYIKNTFDFILAILALVLLSPLFLVVCILLFIANKGSVFFTQVRPGMDEKAFKLIKFKTMNDNKDENGNLLSDAKRLTTVGKWVRKLSLDEMPQLLNVIMGDMSLIGPRPLLMEYLSLYNSTQMLRHTIKPGITGWAQINGRNTIDWETKFEYDIWYVENCGAWLDIRILCLTVIKVLKIEGISSETSATMEKFTGSSK
ncbi:MAG: undecaprenyl phosphate N,N'-diacetylbacillosamine 1-phosphate transferase [Bacteroidia bacterium]|jgi:lipopolysaccharide/colanic/teichoic acid biosynthesis glycosyltransferase